MTSQRIAQIQNTLGPLFTWIGGYLKAYERAGPTACNFAAGNPQEMPLAGFVTALQHHAVPQHSDWYGYKQSEAASRAHVARTLQQRMGLPFAPESIHMTNGAAGALHIAFYALLDAGDEVIMNLPPWFFYESFIQAAGGVPVKVPVRADDFDLDVAAIAAAITPKTRAAVVNSPNNPTGKIYPADTLQALARVLREASARYGRPIYLISDEAYNRIVFDGRSFESPVSFYENALLIYTYGKTLLTPGQWLGYIALHPQAHARAGLSDALHTAQWVNGFAWPSALMQYALPDFERMLIDVEALQHKRDWMVRELRSMGYIVSMPEGTFYLMVRSPLQDDVTFVRHLTGQSIFCLPGSVMEVPGWFRISLTANEDMIARSLAGFACLAPGSSE